MRPFESCNSANEAFPCIRRDINRPAIITFLPFLKSCLISAVIASTGNKSAGYGLMPKALNCMSFSLRTCSCSDNCMIRFLKCYIFSRQLQK